MGSLTSRSRDDCSEALHLRDDSLARLLNPFFPSLIGRWSLFLTEGGERGDVLFPGGEKY